MVGSPATRVRAGSTARLAGRVVGSQPTAAEVTQLVAPPSQCATQLPARRPAQSPLAGRRKQDWANDLLARLLYGGNCGHTDCLETEG